MFKKIASIILAAMLICSMTVIAVSAVETDEAVAAADESAVGADDNSAVGADDASGSTGAGSKIYFDANSAGWKNFSFITFYLYQHGDGGGEIITWGSKKGNMKDEGNGTWSFDLEAKGYGLDSSKSYGCIFTADWGVQTCDLIIGTACYGDTAYCTGNMVENNVDSNKKSYEVKWKNADPTKYGNPKCITSIGNVIGDAYWPDEDAYSMFVKFISTDDEKSIVNALKYNGKSEQQTIDDAAAALGLGKADIEKAIKESGKTFDWKSGESSAAEGSSTGGSSGSSGGSSGSSGGSESGSGSSGGSSDTSGGSSDSGSGGTSGGSEGGSGGTTGGGTTGGGTTGGGTTGGGTASGGASGGSGGGDGTNSVTSGEESTIYFILGGVMLAAAGVFFLARKRRDY